MEDNLKLVGLVALSTLVVVGIIWQIALSVIWVWGFWILWLSHYQS